MAIDHLAIAADAYQRWHEIHGDEPFLPVAQFKHLSDRDRIAWREATMTVIMEFWAAHSRRAEGKTNPDGDS